MARAKILIVEDESIIALDLKNLLTGLGYQVSGIAQTGEDALQQVEADPPDLALMDLRLSGKMDGLQAAELIYSKYDIPVIYLTAFAGETTLRRSRATEPFGFLFKPFDDKQLFVTIEVALHRHELENKIKERESWLNTILRSIGDGVIVVDEQGQVRFLNRVAEALTDWNQDDAIERPLYEIFKVLDEKTQSPIDIVSQQSEIWPTSSQEGYQLLLVAKDGRKTPVETSVAPIQDNFGEVRGLVLAFRDISGQRQSVEEIRRQVRRTEALLHVAKHMNSLLDLDKVMASVLQETVHALKMDAAGILLYDEPSSVYRLVATHSQMDGLLKYRDQPIEVPRSFLESVLSRPEPVLIIPDLRQISYKPLEAMIATEDFRTLGIAKLNMGETLIGTLNILSVGKVRQFTEDELSTLIGLADQAGTAITNARLFEQVRLGRERLKGLSKKLVEVQENERSSLARELHDQIGQVLTGLQFSLESSKNLSGEALKHSLEESQGLIKSLMGQIRENSLSLRPTMLDDLGLLPTLLWHFERYQKQTGIQVLFSHLGFDRRLSQEVETAIYRVIQEALTNIARYARVQEAEVSLTLDENSISISIIDHGSGFEPGKTLESNRTFGLTGMRERVNLLGGQLEIQSAPQVGTQVQVVLPIGQPIERRKHERDRLIS